VTLPFVIPDRAEEWVRLHQPWLEFGGGSPPLKLAGTLFFDYAPPRPSHIVKKMFGDASCSIGDSYDIEISFDRHAPGCPPLPLIREVGSRIAMAGQRHGVSNPLDMHVSKDGYLCLCATPEVHRYLPKGFALNQYISNLVVPFLYGQVFFDRYGAWPWGTYHHGYLGLLESYVEVRNSKKAHPSSELDRLVQSIGREELSARVDKIAIGRDKPHMRNSCICGSRKTFEKCHPELLKYLQRAWSLAHDE
jgi:hypothetical protein